MLLQRYRNDSRREEVDAVKLSQDNAEELEKLTDGVLVQEQDPFDSSKTMIGLNLPTMHGMRRCSEGDYIIYSSGWFYTRCAADFEENWQMT